MVEGTAAPVKMYRLLKRSGYLPCRGGFILFFTILVVVSLVVLFQSSFKESSMSQRNVNAFKHEKRTKIDDTSGKQSDINCITKDEFDKHKVILV